MSFTIGIQNEWQREIMLRHGHYCEVAMDATFGTNEKKLCFNPAHPRSLCTASIPAMLLIFGFLWSLDMLSSATSVMLRNVTYTCHAISIVYDDGL